jgi:hypothetical protein
MIEFITDQEIYSRVLLQEVPASKDFLWLATSDLKRPAYKKKQTLYTIP